MSRAAIYHWVNRLYNHLSQIWKPIYRFIIIHNGNDRLNSSSFMSAANTCIHYCIRFGSLFVLCGIYTLILFEAREYKIQSHSRDRTVSSVQAKLVRRNTHTHTHTHTYSWLTDSVHSRLRVTGWGRGQTKARRGPDAPSDRTTVSQVQMQRWRRLNYSLIWFFIRLICLFAFLLIVILFINMY